MKAKFVSPYKEVGLSSVNATGRNESILRKRRERKRKFKGFTKAINVRVPNIK